MASNVEDDYCFISSPSVKLKCVLCYRVARNPKQHKCGKMVCSLCLEKKGDAPCPECKVKDSNYSEYGRGKEEIRNLPVFCSNNEHGCEWHGIVATLNDHLEKCLYAPISCPNKCSSGGEATTFLRKDREDHLASHCPNRQVQCEHCEEKGTYVHILGGHAQTCKDRPVPCPNAGCGAVIARNKMDEHLRSDCQYTVVQCRYRGLGCNESVQRKDERLHEETSCSAHFSLIANVITTVEGMVKKHEEELCTLKDAECLVFKLTDYHRRKRNNEVFRSESFYISRDGYRMQILVYPNGFNDVRGEFLSVFAEVVEGRNDSKLNWPCSGTVYVDLLNQIADSDHVRGTIRLVDRTINRVAYGKLRFIQLSNLPQRNRVTQFLKDDCLYFRVMAEMKGSKPWLSCGIKSKSILQDVAVNQQTVQASCPVVFKLSGCSSLLENTYYYLDSFYTSPAGYLMQPRVKLFRVNGVRFAAIALEIITGKYDHQLNWPFKGKITYEVLNQFHDEDHGKAVTTAVQNEGVGMPRIVNPLACLICNITRLVYNTLYFRLTIKVDTNKSWLHCSQ